MANTTISEKEFRKSDESAANIASKTHKISLNGLDRAMKSKSQYCHDTFSMLLRFLFPILQKEVTNALLKDVFCACLFNEVWQILRYPKKSFENLMNQLPTLQARHTKSA